MEKKLVQQKSLITIYLFFGGNKSKLIHNNNLNHYRAKDIPISDLMHNAQKVKKSLKFQID